MARLRKNARDYPCKTNSDPKTEQEVLKSNPKRVKKKKQIPKAESDLQLMRTVWLESNSANRE